MRLARICMTTTQFAPVQSGDRLSEQVARQLAAEIRQGRLAPGDRLPTEARLVEQFQVSRTVVREALSRLKSLGLVNSRQGSGVYVHPQAGFAPLSFEAHETASKDAVLQIVEVRRGLEAQSAELAARRRDAAQIVRLNAALEAIEQAVAGGADGVDEDVLFHRAIGEAAANPFLLHTLDYLSQFLHGATRVTRANESRRRDFAAAVRREHVAIVAAIKAGDATRARQAAMRHMDNAMSRIEQADPGFWREAGVQLARPLMTPSDNVP
jgi:GntR family transcriptional regulator, transcriptional repressor for pyruvate dehydrogenase complex